MNIEMVNVTPSLAKEWLKYNKRNRPLDEAHVAQLASDMKAGVYRLNPSPISFLTNGDLGDGQHRLKAVEVSGISQIFVVAKNVEADMLLHFDENKRRTFRDNLLISKRKYATQTAATVSLIYKYAFGLRLSGYARNKPTNERLSSIDKRFENELTVELFAFADRVGRATGIPVAIVSFLVWSGRHINAFETNLFFEKVISGEGLTKGDPAFAYRELALHRNNKLRNSTDTIFNAGIKCLQKCFDGEAITSGHAYKYGKEQQHFTLFTPLDVRGLI